MDVESEIRSAIRLEKKLPGIRKIHVVGRRMAPPSQIRSLVVAGLDSTRDLEEDAMFRGPRTEFPIRGTLVFEPQEPSGPFTATHLLQAV